MTTIFTSRVWPRWSVSARTLSGDVWIVVLENKQSGRAHSLTLSEPLRLRKVFDKYFVLRGTPTDYGIMGIHEVLPRKQDRVLFGAIDGTNLNFLDCVPKDVQGVS